MLNIKYKFITLIPALLWAGIIAFISLFPSSQLPQTSFAVNDKLVHHLLYLSLMVVMFISVFSFLQLNSSNKALKVAILYSSIFSFFYGVIIEILQDIMNLGRSADVYDVLANLSGIIVAVVLILILRVNRLLVKLLEV